MKIGGITKIENGSVDVNKTSHPKKKQTNGANHLLTVSEGLKLKIGAMAKIDINESLHDNKPSHPKKGQTNGANHLITVSEGLN